MKTVLTYGTFDLLHYGHIRLLLRARALGDRLVVGLSTDAFNENQKHKRSFQPYEERRGYLEALRCVDLVVPEECWEQKADDVRRFGADVFVMGDDWRGKFDFLKPLCEVVYLTRTPEISSTQMRAILTPPCGQDADDKRDQPYE